MIWCMVPDIWSSSDRSVLSSLETFCPFTPPLPLTSWKMKISEMNKYPGDIIVLHKCTKNHDHEIYCSGDMAPDRCNCYFDFSLYFFPFTPLSQTKKLKLQKNDLETWRYHFTLVYQKSWSYVILFLRYGMCWM